MNSLFQWIQTLESGQQVSVVVAAIALVGVLLTGLFALLTASVNAWSSTLTKRMEAKYQRDQWLRDKLWKDYSESLDYITSVDTYPIKTQIRQSVLRLDAAMSSMSHSYLPVCGPNNPFVGYSDPAGSIKRASDDIVKFLDGINDMRTKRPVVNAGVLVDHNPEELNEYINEYLKETNIFYSELFSSLNTAKRFAHDMANKGLSTVEVGEFRKILDHINNKFVIDFDKHKPNSMKFRMFLANRMRKV